MPEIAPGSGGVSTSARQGWVREDDTGEFVPCGCGKAVQRPDPEVTTAVQAQYAAVGETARRVFVCEREACDRRTVQVADHDKEGNR
jgi:hypothetical protein